MDSDSIPLIIVLGVLVLFSAYFSASETAFTSINRIKLKTMAQDAPGFNYIALDGVQNCIDAIKEYC